MRKSRLSEVLILAVAMWLLPASGAWAGALVPGLDDGTALIDLTAAQAGVPSAIVPVESGAITLAARFNASAASLAGGPVIIIETGGTTFGTGLWLADGQVIFASSGSNGTGGRYAVPTSLNDFDVSDSAAVVTLGPVTAGEETTVFASYNSATGVLVTSVNGSPQQFTITGSSGTSNLSGDESVSFLGDGTINYGQMGGLTEGEGAQTDLPVLWFQNAVNMAQTAGYAGQRGQIFAAAIPMTVFPHTPSPADGALTVDPALVSELSFYTAEDPANPGSQNPSVTGHWVRVLHTDVSGDPNRLVAPEFEQFVAAGADPIVVDYSFELDDVVYWQVEEQIGGAAAGDAGNIFGPIWRFDALPSVPAVTVAPVRSAVKPGEAAAFTCEFVSKAEPTVVEWYRTSDPENALSDADPDISLELTSEDQTYTSTLRMANVEIADQDTYYCHMENSSGGTDSAAGPLGVERLMAYWPLDGNFIDASPDGLYNLDPNVWPLPEQWVAGATAVTGQALDLIPEPLAAAATPRVAMAAYTDELTISLWAKWTGVAGENQGLVCSRNEGTTPNNWFFEIRPDGMLRANAPGYSEFVAPMPAGEWAHLVLTSSVDEVGVIYINGIEAARSTAYSIGQDEVPVFVGMAGRPDMPNDIFQGVLDDIKIYNYALDGVEVAREYYEATGEVVCTAPVPYDTNDDCRFDLVDLASVLERWLSSNLYEPAM